MPDPSALSLVKPERINDWRVIVQHTRDMLHAANAGDWDRVTTLESQRREDIARFFAIAVAPYEAQQVRDGIREILESDAKLLALTRGQCAQTTGNIVQMRQRANAHKAYEATAACQTVP